MFKLSRGRAARAGAFALSVSSGLVAVPARAQMQPAAHPHVHGVASVDVAIDPASITVTMSSPLDNLIGFEHPPRTDGERAAAKAAVATLQQGGTVFAIDAAAGCTMKSVELSSAALDVGHPDPSEAQAGHADIDGTYEFACISPQRAKFIDVGLFQFAHMQKVAAQVAGPLGQFKLELTPSRRRLVLSN